MTIDRLLSDIVEREGGFVLHRNDRGGATNHGVTLETLRDWRADPNVSPRDMQALSVTEAKQIYRRLYIEDPGYADAITNERLLTLVVDYAVHSGPGRATRALQRALGVTDDGVIGPETERALAQRGDALDVYRHLLADRLKFLVRLVLADPTQRAFLDGWMNRLVSFL